MMDTKVVNLKNEMYDVYIGRAGKGQDGYFGNPFRLHSNESRGSTLERYREYFYGRIDTDPVFRERIHALKGKTLGCFCKPYPCHGDIIAEYLNSMKDPLKIVKHNKMSIIDLYGVDCVIQSYAKDDFVNLSPIQDGRTVNLCDKLYNIRIDFTKDTIGTDCGKETPAWRSLVEKINIKNLKLALDNYFHPAI